MSDAPAYQVLARKYRPQTFADLIGQDAMVRTLRNAFEAARIAQAFVLTGIRGTGKTSTARIVAKGLNCTGADGTGGPTTEPCGLCASCLAIADGRHVDVLEIDAASHTGVQNVRDVIIDTVAYAPTQARFRVFIIDEVHMLSPSAFNALLKTLEEPPPHVKFVFATTEIRKVPVTVLSRCQRFDLRRIEPEVMLAHLRRIAAAEAAQIDDEALALITRAAEGSVRDALSLMDQAISQGAEATGTAVRAMLGLADRGRVIDLFECIMRGQAAHALDDLAGLYADGADPIAVLRDLAEITHWVSLAKINPDTADDPTLAPDERVRGRALADGLSMRALTRMWQMLLKALEEVALAPNAMMAAEMAVIRLTHVADLPDPAQLLRRLQETTPAAAVAPASAPAPRTGGPAARAAAVAPPNTARAPSGAGVTGSAMLAPAATPETALARFGTFADVLDLISANRDVQLLVQVEKHVRLARYAPGRIEFEPAGAAPRDLAARLAQRLQSWTGARWVVSVVTEGGAASVVEQRDSDRLTAEAGAHDDPLVRAVFAAFPKARIAAIRTAREARAEAEQTALPEVDENWDPFEDE